MAGVVALYIAPRGKDAAERFVHADEYMAALEAGRRADWAAGEAAIEAVDAHMLEKCESPSWGEAADDLDVETPLGRGTLLGVPTAQRILRADCQVVREALDTPPVGLSTITFDDGAVVHCLDEQALDDGLGDALERLRDFGILQATGFILGRW